MQRVVTLFGAAFPPVVLMTLGYAGLGNAVFAVNRVVGRRLNARLRRWSRRCYLAINTVAGAILHCALLNYCYASDACAARPLEGQGCLGMASVAVLCLGAVRGADRVIVPLLDVRDCPGYEVGFRARIAHGIVLCVTWMCISEGEVLVIVLLLATTARRTFAMVPFLGSCYVVTLRLYVLLHTSRVLRHECDSAITQRLPVAVMSTMLIV